MRRVQNLELSIQNYMESNWENAISQITEKLCEKYYISFFQQAQDANTHGDSIQEEIYTLLGGICSLHFDIDSRDVFCPQWFDPSGRSFALEDLNDQQINVLAEIAPHIRDADMRARVADVVWLKGRRGYFRLVDIAVLAYTESANSLLHLPAKLARLRAIDRLKRALSLASIDRQNARLESLLNNIVDLLTTHPVDDPDFPFNPILRVLLDYKHKLTAQYAVLITLSETLAKSAEGQRNWLGAVGYWHITADWNHCSGNETAKRQSLINAAEAHFHAGEQYASLTQPNYGAATFQLERAIDVYRSIGGMRLRCDEIQNRILMYQRSAVSDFGHYSFSLDVSEMVKESQQAVAGKPLVEAILTLAHCQRPTDTQSLRQQVEEYLKEAPFQTLFSIAMTDEDGKISATAPSLIDAADEERERTIEARMCMEAKHHYHLVAVAIIAPMLHQISLDHQLTLDELAFLVRCNSFIAPDQEILFLKGLQAGFHGDFLVASHLLVPLVESSIRYVLKQHGEITSSLNTQTRIQEVYVLDTLLGMPKVLQIFGKDNTFDLQCMLIRRFGLNLRNRLTHGLMSSGEFSSFEIMYFWWFILRLCVLGLPRESTDNTPPTTT